MNALPDSGAEPQVLRRRSLLLCGARMVSSRARPYGKRGGRDLYVILS